MSLIRELRRRGGRFRDRLLHGRADQALAQEAEQLRTGWIAEAARSLPPVATGARDGRQILMLSGAGQIDMGVWAAWSLMRFFPQATLVLVDDGTLRSEDIDLLNRAIGNLDIVSAAEGQAGMRSYLADFPRLIAWCESYFCGAKLGVFQSVIRDDPVIEMDTDTISYRTADYLRSHLDARTAFGWHADNRRCYAYSDAILSELAGDLFDISNLPDRLNAGFIVSHRVPRDALARLEELLIRFERDPRTDPGRYWMHQTLIALLATRHPEHARKFEAPRSIYRGPTDPDALMRHFVGAPGIRPRFFTEGVPRLIREARDLGQLPTDFCRAVCP